MNVLAALIALALAYTAGRTRPWLLIRDTAMSTLIHARRGRTNRAVLLVAYAINADRTLAALWRRRYRPTPPPRQAPAVVHEAGRRPTVISRHRSPDA